MKEKRVALPALARSMVLGFVATVVDLAVLTFLVERVALSKEVANWPALLAGALLQFAGNKWFVFPNPAGRLVRQGIWFTVVEVATFGLNGLLFHLLAGLSPVPYQATGVALGAVVYLGFSFPVWRLIFAAGAGGGSGREGSGGEACSI